jgi:hypothetical protein
MVAWFLTAILTVGLFAYISLTGVGLVSNTQVSSQRSEAVRRLDMVIQGLQSQSAAPLADGVIYAPAGTFRNGVYGLPSELLPVGVTAFGSKFVYCPMGGLNGPFNDNVTFSSGSYGIRTAELNDRSYVVAGRAAVGGTNDQNVMAYVIAPDAGDGAVPGCNDIVRNGDAYSAPNGIVRVLRRSTVADVDAVRADSGNTWYVTPEGRGNGQSPGTPASLTTALAAYRASLGGSFNVVLGGGTYSSGDALLDQNTTPITAKKDSSSLILSSPTAAAIRIGGAINVPSNLELKNVDLTGTPVYAETGRYLRSTNSSLGPLIARSRSRVILTGSNVVRGFQGATASLYQMTGSALSLTGGTLTLSYVSGVPAWRLEAGASSLLTSSTLVLNPADTSAAGTTQSQLVVSEQNSQMIFKSSIVNSNGPASYPMMIAGRLTAYTTTFTMNAPTLVGIQGIPGARIDLPDVTIQASRPMQYAISSVGGSSVTGFGNLSASTRCWYRGEGSIFRYSNVGYQGMSSVVTGAETPQPMSPQPTALQVQRYQAAVGRNVERTSLNSTLVAPKSGTGINGFVCQSAPAATYQTCATENGDCVMNDKVGTGQVTAVRYGAGNSWITKMVGPEGIPCTNAVWTDPIVGTVKTCQYMPS